MSFVVLLLLCALNFQCSTCFAQSTAITYQGSLQDNGLPANGLFDLRFQLFAASNAVTAIGSSITNPAVLVSNGLFAVTVDFGAGVFPGADRWLEIGVRPSGDGSFETLMPRQRVTSAPYAITAGNLTGVVPASGLSGTYSSAVNFSAAGNVFAGDGSGLKSLNASQLTSGTVPAAALDNAWKTTGNAGTTERVHFLGTTDDQPLEFQVNGLRAFRLEDNGDGDDPGVLPDGAPNVIGGAPLNFVGPGVVGATIAGGGALDYAGFAYSNAVLADYGAIGGGRGHRIEGNARNSTIGGGFQNSIFNSVYATIGGGQGNDIGAHNSVIGGGNKNTIADNSDNSAIAGGANNLIGEGSPAGTIGGGQMNSITNANAAMIPGGLANQVGDSADYAFAAGRRAHANHPGAFVWADSQDADFASQRDNQFHVRAAGGARFDVGGGAWVEVLRKGSIFNPPLKLIDSSGGGYLSQGGAWVDSSDREKKRNFKPVEPANILEQVLSLPITTWNYEAESSDVRHIGPVAQDFHARFAVGADDKHIAPLDGNGVALAAIQGLNRKTEDRSRRAKVRIQASENRIQKLEAENARLQHELEELRQLVDSLCHSSGLLQ